MDDGKDIIARRLVRHTACFTSIENALLMTRVEIAAVPVSTYLRCAALDFPIPRAARRPTTNHQDVVRLLGELGQLATAFRQAHMLADADAAEAAIRDLAELRLLCFDALGRAP
ncbi:MAG: hypothetical protein E5X57_21970 [Mesorhizobium sp.]|uniref:plasmid mobilization protein n=1 Tax=Mesorhizobium sp. TaxID=1871066 RepID=UPI0011FD30B9|nr:hypothetical protein [Mesorhizobium sp.]TIQ08752.1 MAG: hypothetical protein E5X57_21970 [Mesorhizobium sp.]TJV92404.1 MAG: hypothetical protein E5X52_33560 [Mesorhizobium sp.]